MGARERYHGDDRVARSKPSERLSDRRRDRYPPVPRKKSPPNTSCRRRRRRRRQQPRSLGRKSVRALRRDFDACRKCAFVSSVTNATTAAAEECRRRTALGSRYRGLSSARSLRSDRAILGNGDQTTVSNCRFVTWTKLGANANDNNCVQYISGTNFDTVYRALQWLISSNTLLV